MQTDFFHLSARNMEMAKSGPVQKPGTALVTDRDMANELSEEESPDFLEMVLEIAQTFELLPQNVLEMVGTEGLQIFSESEISETVLPELEQMLGNIVRDLSVLKQSTKTKAAVPAETAFFLNTPEEPVLPVQEMPEKNQTDDLLFRVKKDSGEKSEGLLQRFLSENSFRTATGQPLQTAAEAEIPPESILTGEKTVRFSDENNSKFQRIKTDISKSGADIRDMHLFSETFSVNKAGEQAERVKGAESRPRIGSSEILGQIIDKARLSVSNGVPEIKISLKPESLGHLRMNISSENQHLSIKIMADSHMVADIIESNVAKLKADLQSQGLQILRLDVSVSQDSKQFQSAYQQGQAEWQQRGEDDKTGNGGIITDSDDNTEMPQNPGKVIMLKRIDFYA
ncbi:MAG: flagellar hook-length control protein FliK [Desulfococcaceae bacterium]|jgi:flagellar hook-length control protein FliK|nr:flagellar hook-length control protein FliK [Desulfococcaceae bacterium]